MFVITKPDLETKVSKSTKLLILEQAPGAKDMASRQRSCLQGFLELEQDQKWNQRAIKITELDTMTCMT